MNVRVVLLLLCGVRFSLGTAVAQDAIRLEHDGLVLSIDPKGMGYGFERAGHVLLAPSSQAGITVDGRPVSAEAPFTCAKESCTFHAKSATGEHVTVAATMQPHRVTLSAETDTPNRDVRFITGGAVPAFGLADHAAERKNFTTGTKTSFTTDVTGFADDSFRSGQGNARLVSNFVIFPRQHFAEVLLEPSAKVVHVSEREIVQGVAGGKDIGSPDRRRVTIVYLFGTPHEIYGEYLAVRREAGYQVMLPKYRAFQVGWEAFGALGWDTNQKTVTESIDRYLALGYPLKWAVLGSGFWPEEPASMHETTSFGYWNTKKYPNPLTMRQHLHERDIAFLMGLRITFITTGPYAAEGSGKGYFLKGKNGRPQSFSGPWPKLPYYLLDAHQPAALDWYMSLVKKWQAYGVDGWKEDYYGYENYPLRDDKIDPINNRLMAQGQLLIERNGYLSSNGDLHRINDFNYEQNQDRGPVNALALAYSGFPFVYPDIVGGTFGENHFTTTRTPKMQIYMQRNAQWAALHSSMSMGEPPWSFDAKTAEIMLKSAKLHQRIAPYLYANAIRSVADGFPWTMTPLPLAYPDDPKIYGRDNATQHGYEWLIGDALLATPLYGEDYATAETRNVYLPAGMWMDYDTGTLYPGGQTLTNYPLPAGKTPLFVGGSGITLQNEGEAVMAFVYPLGQTASVRLRMPHGPEPVTISVEHAPAGAWKTVSVTDHEGHGVPVQYHDHALVFEPKPGEQYRVSPK